MHKIQISHSFLFFPIFVKSFFFSVFKFIFNGISLSLCIRRIRALINIQVQNSFDCEEINKKNSFFDEIYDATQFRHPKNGYIIN